ncbi:GH39 family glycosyl hydrolase [Plantactinospora sp. CA-294935]|uniref:GH39 family glycosyl hydrolase n=1 Tax=Plantactinospora sp. CA-294935 TaxID=3240012 RepID=UPI003D8C37DF
MNHRKSLIALGAASAVFAGCVLPATPASAAPATFSVNFAVDEGPVQHAASGFLHGISATSPEQYLVDGVNVTAIRGADYHPNLPSLYDPATNARVEATGADTMVGLYYYRSDPTNPLHTYWPGDGGDWQTWRDIVTNVYTESVTRGYHVDSWIAWNEPNLQWNTSAHPYSRFLQTFDVAHDTLKAISPDIKIQGPEIYGFNFPLLTQFLDYCRANDCLPDMLTWHELSSTPSNVEANTARIKQWMVDSGIQPMPLAVTEYQGGGYGSPTPYNVGDNVAWLAQIERSTDNGLAYGLYSAWEWNGDDPNFRATLGNATARSADLPRGVWWNYNTYREMTGRRVGETSSAGVDGFGAVDASMKRATFLVGNQEATSKEIDLSLVNLDSAPYLVRKGKIHLTVSKIPNTGTVTEPTQVIDADFRVKGGNVTLPLPSLPGQGAYRISISQAVAEIKTVSYEAESLPAAASPAVPYRVIDDPRASGGAATVLDADSVGRSVRYSVAAPTTGVYDVSATLKKATAHGIVQLYVKGRAYGGPRDEFGTTEQYYRSGFGMIPLDRGPNVLEFRVVSRHPQSDSYKFVLDKLELKKVG